LLRAVIVKVTVLPSVGLAVLTVLVTARSAWTAGGLATTTTCRPSDRPARNTIFPAPLIPPNRSDCTVRAEERVALADDQCWRSDRSR